MYSMFEFPELNLGMTAEREQLATPTTSQRMQMDPDTSGNTARSTMAPHDDSNSNTSIMSSSTVITSTGNILQRIDDVNSSNNNNIMLSINNNPITNNINTNTILSFNNTRGNMSNGSSNTPSDVSFVRTEFTSPSPSSGRFSMLSTSTSGDPNQPYSAYLPTVLNLTGQTHPNPSLNQGQFPIQPTSVRYGLSLPLRPRFEHPVMPTMATQPMTVPLTGRHAATSVKKPRKPRKSKVQQQQQQQQQLQQQHLQQQQFLHQHHQQQAQLQARLRGGGAGGQIMSLESHFVPNEVPQLYGTHPQGYFVPTTSQMMPKPVTYVPSPVQHNAKFIPTPSYMFDCHPPPHQGHPHPPPSPCNIFTFDHADMLNHSNSSQYAHMVQSWSVR